MTKSSYYSALASGREPEIALRSGGVEIADRPVPRWWRLTFLATIALGALYLLYYMPGADNRGLIAAYDGAVTENLQKQFAGIVLQPDRATIVKYMNEPEWLGYGKTLFHNNCEKCHGPEGVGLVGPNLRDNAWIHVNKLEDIAAVIAGGAKNGAMPAWKTRFHPNEIVFLAAYVASLRGQPGSSAGKPPERDSKIIPPWNAE